MLRILWKKSFRNFSGGGSPAGLRTLPSKTPPRGGKGGHEGGGGTKVEGFKPCYEGKVRRGFTLPLKVDGNGGLELIFKVRCKVQRLGLFSPSHLQGKVEGGGYKRFIKGLYWVSRGLHNGFIEDLQASYELYRYRVYKGSIWNLLEVYSDFMRGLQRAYSGGEGGMGFKMGL